MKNILLTVVLFLTTLCARAAAPTPLDSLFLFPPQEAKPIMIWQWMDGLVTREGITRDLEAYRDAGIGGVQNFLIGGDMQGLIRDTVNAVGTDNWQRLMAFAIDECARLGLSYGTHNCPGWSSSGYPTVKPKDSMQKIVFTETKVSGRWKGELPRPDVDPQYNYYEDIAVVAIPDSEVADTVILLGNNPQIDWKAPRGNWLLLRIGHTTNGQTNGSTAPYGGAGLEVDKMSREAVDRYWQGYPSLLLRLSGNHAGHTFQRMEIDSYEAGDQDWTPLMPEEFERRCGYSLMRWLPVLTGHTVESKEATQRFQKQWRGVIAQLFAENYYGEMNRLAQLTPGLKLLIQPYGTPLDSRLCVNAAPGSLLCGEFWTHPANWGGGSVKRMAAIAHATGHRELYAEGLTCWPLFAWQDDPASLKAVIDANMLLGVNHLMLHAAASNPWTSARPGMSFGKWGTQFQYTQTWWPIGARPLFRYVARCQALLQAGDYHKSGVCRRGTAYLWRKTATDDIFFIANTSDSTVTDTIDVSTGNTVAELWFADSGERMQAVATAANGTVSAPFTLEPHGSVFVVIGKDGHGAAPYRQKPALADSRQPLLHVATPWRVTFPEQGHETHEWSLEATTDTLPSWTTSDNNDIKYFSGTATYATTVKIGAKQLRKAERLCLDLGKVRNVAVVRVNGTVCDTLWKAPFVADITRAMHRGDNTIEVEVANLWPNRMIGDEYEPDDMEWSEEFHYSYAKGNPAIGRFLKAVPAWLRDGTPRPSLNRRTVSCFKFFTKDSPLLESGLIGPVRLFGLDD